MALYTWGSNKFGELGGENTSWSPQSLCLPDGQLPVSVAAGEGHSLFATESGDVFTFGRGREGQLGLGSEKRDVNTPTLVQELQHESVIKVVAGAISSYAITATGRVYHWGLVHIPCDGSAEEESEPQTTAGELTGLAEDQDSVMVEVDIEAREESYRITGTGGTRSQQGARQLRSIVQHSTERWMLANDDADEEYYRELSSMGYEKEEVEERMQNRGREYHGMMRLQCRRVFLTTPEVISSLSHIRVASVAAGYAHCIVVTESGHMFSVGYNDRGQLGLGHRISTSEFKPVDYMDGRFVVQVVCGQQHSMCRAVERNNSAGLRVGSGSSRVGCSVYVWGNGMLGQLGLGLKGTSKGRLLPTLLSTLVDECPLGVIDISAGSNFSAALSFEGAVFSWGHAEYNQHGTGTVGGSDYVNNFHYFVPRRVRILSESGEPERISAISCGSTFTIAVSEDSDVYSWGWNAYGVLGHGKGHFPQEPTKIANLGKQHVDRKVSTVSAGANHVLAITSSSGNPWAKTFQSFLNDDSYADAEIIDETSGESFACHRVILSARSTYFKGFFRVAQRVRDSQNSVNDCQYREAVYLSCDVATSANIKYLLEYIYTDTLSAPMHRRKQLALLADFVAIPRLAQLCRQHGSYAVRRCEGDDIIASSSFESDMLDMVASPLFSDVRFVYRAGLEFYHNVERSSTNMPTSLEYNPDSHCIPGHRVLLSKLPYFQNIFSGQYKDGQIGTDGVMELDMCGLELDGVDEETFRHILMYAYCGTCSVLDDNNSNALMSLIVAANRVGLLQLAQLCEKLLSLHLGDFPENIENCYDFAQMYNISRLGRQCEELLYHRNMRHKQEVSGDEEKLSL